MLKGSRQNKHCPCGSGKKYKNCCLNKKTVVESALFEFSTSIRSAHISIGQNGEFNVFNADGEPIPVKNASYLRSYQKNNNKGEKILTKIPMGSPILPRHELEYLLSFHALYAIDTNTDKTTKVSAATAIKCNLSIANQTREGTIIKGQALMESEIINQQYWIDLDVNPEKVAIQSLIMGIHYLPGTRIGIINDCDLGSMPMINAREIPLIDDYYIPNAFTLIYASADAGKDSIANKLITDCDKHSTEMLREITSNLPKYMPK